ncbi:phage tail protein [Pasteurella caecimuris]|uniref:phage tail protein n=1 Tax=Rodentibacter caecimuris TaxID=1796644 RepID=UPI00214F8069|nr:phage tail protein [Pasteurella caecimuris]MCR1838656.1 phage tail protein [Pasteurella caecimuris]MCU0108029.1 phage tail protein [Pasteurella caecimuris]
MYFMLGNIAFEPVNLTDFSETHSADFAEHAVLKGKPRLQAMGEKLTELSFAIRLHHKIGGVESRYQALLAAKAKQEALALIWGAGKYKGNYVITDISSTTLFTDAKGNALCREMTISLTEFVGNSTQGLLGAALNIGGKSLLGSMLPQGLSATLSTVKTVVSRGVEIYNQGKRAVDEVRNTVAVIRQLADDPVSALAYLPGTITNLDSALENFGKLVGMQSGFDSVRQVLPVVAEFSRDVTAIYADLQQMKQNFSQANETGWEDWFTPSDNALTNINERVDSLSAPVANMTAWIVLRTDEQNQDNQEANNDSNRA